MTQHTYDLLVIGGGSAGSNTATAVAEQGRRVVLIERDKLGGTCLNYGCDPTKTLIHLADQIAAARKADATGLHFGMPSVDWTQVQSYLRSLVDRLRGGSDPEARQKLQDQGVDTIKGEARFISAHEVAVGEDTFRADKIVIAVGSSAVVPDIPGLRDAGFLTNREAIWLDTLPRRMVILGGGPIGIEFAQIFYRFGVEVTLLEQGEQILSKDDSELAAQLRTILTDEGIRIETGVEIEQVERSGDERTVHFTSADGESEVLATDAILVATGFKPVIEKLNLEAAGVSVEDGAITVDKTLRTSVDHIWAAGDVLDTYQFTHVASTQGRLLVDNLFADKPKPFDDRVVPWVTYTSPELAHVGKTEEELQKADVEYTVHKQEMNDVERAVAIGQTDGFVKLLVGKDGKLLGGHILAAHAGEMIAPITLAMHAELTLTDLAETILPYPTLTEAVRRAAQSE